MSVERSNTAYNSLLIAVALCFMSCSLCSYVCIGLPGPAHPPKVKYSLKAVIVACSLCSYVCIGLPGPAHPPKVKYSLKICYCGLFYVFAFQDQHTLPKWSYLYIFMVFIAHVVSVERSNTAYNSLHIVCIGFMSWVLKDARKPRSSCEKIKDRINTNRLFVILFKCRECREVQDQIIQNVSILCRECRHGSFYSTLNLIDFMSLVSRDQRQNSITNNIECIDFMS